jgi:aminoglycoside/choline kinase family phosphotransferase
VIEERVRAFLVERGIEGRPLPMAGDASDRTFLRLEGEGAVLMVRRDPFLPSRDPFCRSSELLAACGVRVPRILATDGRRGLVLVEDCGDALLSLALPGLGDEERDLWYGRALEIVLRIQRGTFRLRPGEPAGAERLGPERLGWELLFFHRWWIGEMRGGELAPDEETTLRAFYRALAREAWLVQPPVLCHRDFHARNLLIHEGELVVVDHQDARWGPPLYDVASLARDPYVTLPPGVEERLLGDWAGAGGTSADALRLAYERVALQRNLKAAGTYAFQLATHGREQYRPSLAPTLEHARRALVALHRFHPYASALAVLESRGLLDAA